MSATIATSASHVRLELDGARDLLALAAADPQRYPCLLESVSGGQHCRYDILFAYPEEKIELRQLTDFDFVTALDDAWRTERSEERDDLPFRSGWIVFLSYELAGQIESGLRLPTAPDASLPIALAVRCRSAIVVDKLRSITTIVCEASVSERMSHMLHDLESSVQSVATPIHARVEEDDPHAFLAGVDRIHEYLRSGDTFQINLSREWRAQLDHRVAPADVYANLRRANPSPFAGLLQWRDAAVISSSPERLIEVRHGVAQTRPIAGTRPRTSDDASRIRELVANPKERAEHIMLIDLERNDLGRVCRAGTVRVDELMSVESYAHVHHIVSNVRGELRDNATPGDVIRAVFPGGTITGCPKVRCMEIIAELERVGRAAYTGALGYLDCNGDMDLNILIRTLTLSGDIARFRAGAGIVADSDAQKELDETRAKARGLLRAFGAQS